MADRWQLQEAKNKFSEVIKAALQHGPQVITRRGVNTAVLLSYDDYRKLRLSRSKLSDFFRRSPLVGVPLDLPRNRSPLRDDISL